MQHYSELIQIRKIFEIEQNIQKGDWIFFDIDGTLLKEQSNKFQVKAQVIDQKAVDMINRLQAHNIKVFCLTARKHHFKKTIQQLRDVGLKLTPFPRNVVKKITKTIQFEQSYHCLKGGILFAGNKKDKTPLKGRVLNLFIKQVEEISGDKPSRIVVIDDLATQLFSVKNESLYPCTLYHFVPFADLSGLTYHHEHLIGGSGGVYVLENQQGEKFTLKKSNSKQAFKEEILTDAVYRALGFSVPEFTIYYTLPEDLARELNLSTEGPIRLARYIEKDPNWLNEKDNIAQQMSEGFVLDAFLGNVDLAAKWDNIVLDPSKKLWRVDNGSNIRRRALGKSKRYDCQISELRTLRDPAISCLGPIFYGHLSEEAIKEQALQILEKADIICQTIEDYHLRLNFERKEELVELFCDRLSALRDLYHPHFPLFSEKYSKAIEGVTSAGVLVYSWIANEPYILLGKRIRHEWWGNPGGKSDWQDGFLTNTAARETCEETFGLMAFSAHELMHLPHDDLITSSKDGYQKYRMYVARHSHISAATFRELLQKPEGKSSEFTDYNWINARDLLSALDNPQWMVLESQAVFKLVAKNEWGETVKIPIHPPLYSMLQQEKTKNRLKLIVNPIEQEKPKEVRRFKIVPPQQVAYESAVFVHRHSQVVLGIKSINPKNKVDENQPFRIQWPEAQSQLHLKSILNKDYCEGDLKGNLDKFFKIYASNYSDNIEVKEIFHSILMEEKRRADKIVFYHAADAGICFLVTFFTELRKQLSLESSDEFKIFRPFDHHFCFANVSEFINHFQKASAKNVIYNYQGNYQEMGLSTNLFLFGCHDNCTSTTYRLFLENSSRYPPQMEALLAYVVKCLGISRINLKKLMDLYLNAYAHLGGTLYQIFMHPDIVDQIAYPAGTLGAFNPMNWKEKQIDSIRAILNIIKTNPQLHSSYLKNLQARIYLKPEFMHDTSLVQVREYYNRKVDPRLLESQNQLKEIVKELVLEVLTTTKALIPNLFKVQPPLFEHLSALSQRNGISLQKQTNEMQLAKLIELDSPAQIIEFFNQNPQINPEDLEYINYMKKTHSINKISLREWAVQDNKVNICGAILLIYQQINHPSTKEIIQKYPSIVDIVYRIIEGPLAQPVFLDCVNSVMKIPSSQFNDTIELLLSCKSMLNDNMQSLKFLKVLLKSNVPCDFYKEMVDIAIQLSSQFSKKVSFSDVISILVKVKKPRIATYLEAVAILCKQSQFAFEILGPMKILAKIPDHRWDKTLEMIKAHPGFWDYYEFEEIAKIFMNLKDKKWNLVIEILIKVCKHQIFNLTSVLKFIKNSSDDDLALLLKGINEIIESTSVSLFSNIDDLPLVFSYMQKFWWNELCNAAKFLCNHSNSAQQARASLTYLMEIPDFSSIKILMDLLPITKKWFRYFIGKGLDVFSKIPENRAKIITQILQQCYADTSSADCIKQPLTWLINLPEDEFFITDWDTLVKQTSEFFDREKAPINYHIFHAVMQALYEISPTQRTILTKHVLGLNPYIDYTLIKILKQLAQTPDASTLEKVLLETKVLFYYSELYRNEVLLRIITVLISLNDRWDEILTKAKNLTQGDYLKIDKLIKTLLQISDKQWTQIEPTLTSLSKGIKKKSEIRFLINSLVNIDVNQLPSIQTQSKMLFRHQKSGKERAKIVDALKQLNGRTEIVSLLAPYLAKRKVKDLPTIIAVLNTDVPIDQLKVVGEAAMSLGRKIKSGLQGAEIIRSLVNIPEVKIKFILKIIDKLSNLEYLLLSGELIEALIQIDEDKLLRDIERILNGKYNFLNHEDFKILAKIPLEREHSIWEALSLIPMGETYHFFPGSIVDAILDFPQAEDKEFIKYTYDIFRMLDSSQIKKIMPLLIVKNIDREKFFIEIERLHKERAFQYRPLEELESQIKSIVNLSFEFI